MCGIVGLFAKSESIEKHLGMHLSNMLVQMGERGPDSAGVAFYNDGNQVGKVTVQISENAQRDQLAEEAKSLFSGLDCCFRGSHVVFDVNQDQSNDLVQWLETNHPAANIMSVGRRIEIYKEAVHPNEFVDKYKLNSLSGSHALGHTRMATESAVTTSGSHPFSTGQDLCLVHNGSLSNHNRMRDYLRRHGIQFQTLNDTEVAAGFLTHRLREGDSLQQALEAALVQLDGFYTFAVGTKDGFAVLRDPIACKPAVLAETDEWVAMASEYRAIAQLPGASHANVWEPEPATIYRWENEEVIA